MKSTIYTASTF